MRQNPQTARVASRNKSRGSVIAIVIVAIMAFLVIGVGVGWVGHEGTMTAPRREFQRLPRSAGRGLTGRGLIPLSGRRGEIFRC